MLPVLMLENMRRLYPRGAGNRGVCVDAGGAMLGPDWVLVRQTPQGYRAIGREEAAVLQAAFLDRLEADWLFRQSRHIADALDAGQVSLAQIYGLRIPIGDLDARRLKQRATGATFSKTGFDPDEPRLPKGDPHGGEWTAGEDGGGDAGAAASAGPAAAAVNQVDALSTADGEDGDIAPPTMATGNAQSAAPGSGEDTSSDAPTLAERLAVEHEIGAIGTVASAEGIAGSFLSGALSRQILASLAQLAARMSAPASVLGILFIPTNGNVVVEGTVGNAPDLSYRYDRDTGVIQVWQNDGSGSRTLLDTGHIGPDGLFRDGGGRAIGLALPDGAIIDPDALPGYRAQSDADARASSPSQAIADTAEPKLCPDPTPEDIAGRSDRTVAYQSQITGLPPGLEVVFNGERYDGCVEANGNLLEAKGEGYADFMSDPTTWQQWFTKLVDLENQMDNHWRYSAGRIVEYHFAEKDVAEYFRIYAADKYPNIIVFYTPLRRSR